MNECSTLNGACADARPGQIRIAVVSVAAKIRLQFLAMGASKRIGDCPFEGPAATLAKRGLDPFRLRPAGCTDKTFSRSRPRRTAGLASLGIKKAQAGIEPLG